MFFLFSLNWNDDSIFSKENVQIKYLSSVFILFVSVLNMEWMLILDVNCTVYWTVKYDKTKTHYS